MEDLTPPLLAAVREVRWRIGSGHSMKEAIRLYFEDSNSVFSHRLREWWALKTQDRLGTEADRGFPTHYQKAFIHLIERGCAGQPTLDHLAALEDEIEKAAQAELEMHIGTLPFKVLIPLLVFQFPAYLVVLLGPLLRELTEQLGRAHV